MDKQTALFNFHNENKGKLVSFAGFKLPIWYTSIKEEHVAVRKDSGLFDISHMGVLTITGKHARPFLQKIICNDIEKAQNKMIYAMVLNEEGFILDDVMVGQFEGRYILIVNASNTDKILSWLTKHQDENVTISSQAKTHAFVAVQGPQAVSKLCSVLGESIAEISPFGIGQTPYNAEKITALRTGYTGEDGFELIIPNNQAESLCNDLKNEGVILCGLGARDTLRLEKGLPLYGQELSEEIDPLMTRYQWVVKWDTDFLGKEALLKRKETPQWASVGLLFEERVIPRPHFKIKEGGEVTSGTLSPSLDRPIALAKVPIQYKDIGAKVTVVVRNKEVIATVAKVPFL